MLTITVSGEEHFDQATGQFTYPNAFELQLEHSLVALSKWETKFEKPYLDENEKTTDEVLGYIECMILNDVPPERVLELSEENVQEISNYINRKMTATWFSEIQPESKTSEIITNELIYYWMDMFTIPWEAQFWHLNRLFTLIKIHNHKSQPPKKMSQREIYERNKRLNAERRKALGTSG